MKYISATLTIILALLPYSVYGLTDTAQLFVDYMISAQDYCALMLDQTDRQHELIEDVHELFAQAQYSFLLDDLGEELSRRGLWEAIVAYLAISKQADATTTTTFQSHDYHPGTSDENFDFNAEREKIFSALELTNDDCTESIRQKYNERYKKLLRTTHINNLLIKDCMRAIYNDEHDIVRKTISESLSSLSQARRRALRDMYDLVILSAAIAPEGSPNRGTRISTAIFIKEAAARVGFDITTTDIRKHQGQFLKAQKFSPELTKELQEIFRGYESSTMRAIILGKEVKFIESAHKPTHHNVLYLQKILGLAQRAAQEKPDQVVRGKIVETIAQQYAHMQDTIAAQELVKQQKVLGKRKAEGSPLERNHRDPRMAIKNLLTTTSYTMTQDQETSSSTIASLLSSDTNAAIQQKNLRLDQRKFFLKAQKFSPCLNEDLQNALKHKSLTVRAIIVGDPTLLPHIELTYKPTYRNVLALQKILELAQRAAQEKSDQANRSKIVEIIAQRYAHLRDIVAALELEKQQKRLGKKQTQEQETSRSIIADALSGDTSSSDICAQHNTLATMLMTPPETLYVEDMDPSELHVLQELDFDFDAEHQNLAAMLITPSDLIARPHDTH